MFWSFKKTSEHNNFCLLINIKSKSILFSISTTDSDKEKIVFTSKENFVDKNNLIKSLDEGLKKIVSIALTSLSENKKTAKIKNTEVVLGTEFYDSYIKELVIEKDQPFILTKDQFDKAVQKHSEVINAEKAGKVILEKDVTNVAINGYFLTDPFNKKVKKLDVSFYASFIDKKILDEIQDLIKTNLHTSKITFKSQVLNFFNAFRTNFMNINNYTSITITEETTDVFIVNNGGISYKKSFNLGYQNFIKEISEKCSMHPEVVSSEIKMATLGELNKTCHPEIEKNLIEQKNKWIDLLTKEIIDTEGVSIPSKVFLVTNKNIASIFMSALSDKESRAKIFRNDKEVTLVNCDNKHFSKYIVYKENVESDIFITVNSVNNFQD